MKKTFMSGFIFCFFLGTLSLSTSAQEYKYDISKYYTPDIVRNQLDLSFNTSNTFYNAKTKTDTTQTNYQTNLGGTITPNFVTYTNTRKRFSTLQISGQFSGNYSTNGVVDEQYPNKSFQTNDNLLINYSSHLYNSSKQFLSLGISTNFQTSISGSFHINDTENGDLTNKSYDMKVSPTIGVGFGRIESVEDARQAIYILEELSKKGVLTRHLNDDEIFQFSQQISRVKNKRFLDARLHLIDEITSVDSFLVNNNLLTKSDARYFTTLYDNWQYGALFSRKSGHSFEISFNPSYEWNYANNSPEDTINRNMLNQNILRGGLSLMYIYEKPVNLKWQNSVTVSLNGIKDLSNSINQYGNSFYATGAFGPSVNGFDNQSVGLSGNYTLGFYPNTRTNFSAGISHNSMLFYSKEINVKSDSWDKEFSTNTNLNFNAYYYISPQVRLSFGVNVGYYYSSVLSTKYNQLYGNIGSTLSYSIY